MTNISKELLVMYEGTDYQVFAEAPFTLKINCHSPALQALMGHHRADSATFITAWNPRSETLSDAENTLRMQKLQQMLGALHMVTYNAFGHDPNGQCPGEASLLVLGLPRSAAIQMGRDFDQNAILWNDALAIPELVLLR